jgi:hypothetical protein
MTDYFTTTPASFTPGQPLRVCFNFDAAGITEPLVVTADCGPAQSPTVTLSPAEPCKFITPPSDATSMILSDEKGASEEHAVPLA